MKRTEHVKCETLSRINTLSTTARDYNEINNSIYWKTDSVKEWMGNIETGFQS